MSSSRAISDAVGAQNAATAAIAARVRSLLHSASRSGARLAGKGWRPSGRPVGMRAAGLSRDDLAKAAVLALADGNLRRAARLKARAAAATPSKAETPTLIGDRLIAAAVKIRECLHIDVGSAWAELLLRLPDNARTALADARDGYDAACEALVWSLAYLILGQWWWPAVGGLVLALTSWRWMRNAADALASTAEPVARVAENSPKTAPQP